VYSGFQGICFDIEIAYETGLYPYFHTAFVNAKAKGLLVLVTISYSQPYGFPSVSESSSFMTNVLSDSYVDYISPQLYSTGSETSNVYTTQGLSFSAYQNTNAKIVVSIVCASYYPSAQQYFLSNFNIPLSGFIQWKQVNC
jgi:chitinase